jgi:hypothetical protein
MNSPLNDLRPFGAKSGGFVAVGDLSPQQSPGDLIGRGITRGSFSFFTDEVVFGSSLGGGAVKIYDSMTGDQIGSTFYPFGRAFTGGVRVAIGDVNGDGQGDLIVAQGNFGNQVKVYSGGDPTQLIGSFHVGGSFTGGLNISVGDLDHDGRAEIVAGRNRLSGPLVEIYDFQGGEQLITGTFAKVASFNAFMPTYHQGVRVALADYNLDGTLDIIAAVGYNGKSQVKVFNGAAFLQTGLLPAITKDGSPVLASFTAFPGSPLPGVWVSASAPVPFTGAVPL